MKNKKYYNSRINEDKFWNNTWVAFLLHLFILKGEDIYCLYVYFFILYLTKSWIQIADIPSIICL